MRRSSGDDDAGGGDQKTESVSYDEDPVIDALIKAAAHGLKICLEQGLSISAVDEWEDFDRKMKEHLHAKGEPEYTIKHTISEAWKVADRLSYQWRQC